MAHLVGRICFCIFLQIQFADETLSYYTRRLKIAITNSSRIVHAGDGYFEHIFVYKHSVG
jgi:hypothetical protein